MSKRNLFTQMMTKLKVVSPTSWEDIDQVLSKIQQSNPPQEKISVQEFFQLSRQGLAFLTYDYGIDGVSIEISKYAQSLQDLLFGKEKAAIHLIGGDFFSASGFDSQARVETVSHQGF
jgi:hypothetical protein